MNPIEIFTNLILKNNVPSNSQIAIHEAGHRFFWKVGFPEIETWYAVKDGFPATCRRENTLKLEDMTPDQKVRFCSIKFAGIAAEMIFYRIDAYAEIIADYIVHDFYAKNPDYNWKDDSAHGGDLSSGIWIIRHLSGQQGLAVNLSRVMQCCISNILAHWDEFNAEWQDAMRFFHTDIE